MSISSRELGGSSPGYEALPEALSLRDLAEKNSGSLPESVKLVNNTDAWDLDGTLFFQREQPDGSIKHELNLAAVDILTRLKDLGRDQVICSLGPWERIEKLMEDPKYGWVLCLFSRIYTRESLCVPGITDDPSIIEANQHLKQRKAAGDQALEKWQEINPPEDADEFDIKLLNAFEHGMVDIGKKRVPLRGKPLNWIGAATLTDDTPMRYLPVGMRPNEIIDAQEVNDLEATERDEFIRLRYVERSREHGKRYQIYLEAQGEATTESGNIYSDN